MLAAIDIAAIVKIVIFLVILASWAMRQLNEAQQSQKARQARRDAAPNPPAPAAGQLHDPFAEIEAQPRPPKGTGTAADQVRSEVDEYLRRVAAANQPPSPSSPPPREASPADRSRKPARRPRIEVLTPAPPTAAPRPRRLTDTPSVSPAAQQSVGESVAEHLGQGRLAANSARLGYELSQVDERTEERLKQKFEHRVGHLAKGNTAQVATTAAVAAPVLPAARLAEMLRSPEGMQQAVILNEILTRPVDRW